MLLIEFYFHGLSQNMEYWGYKLEQSDFYIVEAEMVGSSEEIIGSTYRATFSYDTQQIVYYINGLEYRQSTYIFSDKTEGESFFIAVNKENPYSIRRCTPYKLIDNDIITIVLYSSVTLIFLIYRMFFVFVKKRKSRNRYIEKKSDNQLEIQKQNHILSYFNDRVIKSSGEICFSEMEQRLGIVFNESFKWCLLNLSDAAADFHMSLWETEGNQFVFELETLRQREFGLPDKYFLIDKNESYYYCCKESSERIYAFSRALGITNTPYADIYDFVLDKLV